MNKAVFILLFLVCTGLKAQYKAPYFNLLTVDDGLPNSSVISTVQDKYGYLWLGTVNGLARYDGYRLKTYPLYNEEGLPLKATNVTELYEDSNGDLWVAVSLRGYNRLDRKTDRFRYVSLGGEIDSVLKKINVLDHIEVKGKNGAWVLGYDAFRDRQGIYYFDYAGKKVQAYNETEKGDYFLPIRRTIGMKKDHSGRIWAITDSAIYTLDTASRHFKTYFALPDAVNADRFVSLLPDPIDPDLLWLTTIKVTDPKRSPEKDIRGSMVLNIRTKEYQFSSPANTGPGSISENCFHVLTDSLKRIWVSVQNGIYLYERKESRYRAFRLPFPEKDSHAESIVSDPDGNVWIRGSNGGLCFVDLQSGTVFPYESNGGPGSLPTNRAFRDMYFDRSGTFWITIENEGIAWQDRKKSQFAPVPMHFSAGKGISGESSSQYAIVGVEGDSICYLKDSTSLVAWNTISNRFLTIDLKEKKYYNFVLNVVRSRDNKLWMAMGNNGFLQYDPVSRQLSDYTKVAGDSISVAGSFVIDLAIDQKGIIWIATDIYGLMSYDPVARKFKRYPFVINDGSRLVRDSLDDRTATCLMVDKTGIIWIGTNNGGLNSYDPVSRKFRSYMNTQDAFFAITAIYEDSRNRLWASTYLSGLFLVDKQSGNLQVFNEKNGMLFNTVFSVMEDARGQIWVSTSKGLSRINPETKLIANFPSAKPWVYEYTVRGLFDRNGIFNIAGRKGILRFNPQKLDMNSSPPLVYIESVGYRPGGKATDSLLYTEGRDQIHLKYNENRISFQYVALHFSSPEEIQYVYQLEGYDKDWIPGVAQRNVSYSNLPPGTYVFKVKAANSNGVWNETPARFKVIISPPWWKTWWAYCLYVLVALGLIWSYIQIRSKALRRENMVLEQKVEHRTRQLKESIESLKETQSQLIQSEKMASLGELTAGIAHEIQNPLNFVNNFSELNQELLAELNDEIGKGNLNEIRNIYKNVTENEEKILFHGKRADAIVKGMLQHSRAGTGQKEPVDINALCDEYLRLAYHGLRAKDKSFNAKFETYFDTTIGKVNVLPQELGRVILNLINNAFYAVTEKKKSLAGTDAGNGFDPIVRVSTKKMGEKVQINVQDNGTGIPHRLVEKIFQPFFTTKPSGQGTGLGLSLSYDIVTKGHGGELKLESIEGNGTTFIIILPNQTTV